MFQRLINPSKKNSFFIFGARGTGKSTFVQKQFLLGLNQNSNKAVLSLNLLIPEIEDAYIRHPSRLAAEIEGRLKETKKLWVFIDEIQKVPKLLDIIHNQIESHKNVIFILTGSSARKLKRGSANLLAGRAFVYPAFPFTSLELNKHFNLEDALTWGTLPKIYSLENDDDKANYLRSYGLTYLREEIQMEQIVRKLDPFREFLEIAAQCNGRILNLTNIAKDIGSVDHKTVASYFQILEDTLLGFHLPGFSTSVRKAQSKHPKFYFFDCGVKRALERTLDVPLHPKTSAFGDAFEHWVILEIYRLNQYLTKDFRLSYFATRDTEIDLILSKPKQNLVIEIKPAAQVDPDKVARFARLASDIPNAQLYWLSLDHSPQTIEGVSCLHWSDGLKKIFQIRSS